MKHILEYNQYLLESDDETGVELEIEKDSTPDDKKVQSFLDKHWKKIAIVLGTAAVGITASILFNKYKSGSSVTSIIKDTKLLGKIPTDTNDNLKKQQDAIRDIFNSILNDKDLSNDIGSQVEVINILNDNSPEELVTNITEIATIISNKYILKFNEVNNDLGKTIEFLNKNKDRNFEENPLTVKYSDFKLNDKSPNKNNIYIIKNTVDYLKFKRKITSRIKGNIALSDFFKTYPDLIKHRTEIPSLNVTLTASLKDKGNKNGVTKTHLNHFLSNLKQ